MRSTRNEEQLQEIASTKPNFISLCGIADAATEADLSGYKTGAVDTGILAAELLNKPAVSKLNLANNQIGGKSDKDGLNALSEYLGGSTIMAELNLFHNDLRARSRYLCYRRRADVARNIVDP
jgi:hypothetical protein